MLQRWPWFERKFAFDFPANKLPEILDRLIGAPVRIADLLNSVSDETDLEFRESDENWSAKENLGHLAIIEPLWIGRIDDMVEGKEFMRNADLTNQATFQAELNTASKQSITEMVRDARQELVNKINSLSPEQWSTSSLHPRLETPMRVVDLCHFVAEHDDYHIARARELIGLAESSRDTT